jgi:hypothetical protein
MSASIRGRSGMKKALQRFGRHRNSPCVRLGQVEPVLQEHSMANDQKTQEQEPHDEATQDQKAAAALPTREQKQGTNSPLDQADGLKDKKPEDLTPEELRLMADTMPGEGPGD